MCRGSQRIVGLQFHHRPHCHTHCVKRFFQWMKLCEQHSFNSSARFVAGPEVVAKRFNDMIGGDAEVRRAVLDHLRDHVEHTGHGAERWISFLEAPDAVKVSKEFVGAVDEMDDHGGQRSEVRSQMSDVRCQMSEVRCQRSEVRYQMSDVRGQISDVRCQMSDVRSLRFTVYGFRFTVYVS